MELFTDNQTQIYTVNSLTLLIKDILEGEFREVAVKGEISNYRPAASGHVYFTLKDQDATISIALFKGSLSRLKGICLQNGAEVIVRGKISVYPPRGSYQIIANTIQALGAGDLQAKFEALKQKLRDEGLFDEDSKKEIPKFPQKIAVVTSPTGAAVQDVLSVLKRRHSGVHVVVVPTPVQGESADSDIIRAINQSNHPELNADVILLTRGGGSLEDLWCFNSEKLARTIFDSRLPIVSAIGHEIDFTIADFVADLRAPTPSAAAEVLTTEQDQMLEAVEDLIDRMILKIESIFREKKLQLEACRGRLKNPIDRINELRMRFDDWVGRLVQAMRVQVQLLRQEDWTAKASQSMRNRLQKHREQLAHIEVALHSLSPQNVLDRGYSLVFDQKGGLVSSVTQAPPGSLLSVQVSDGRIGAKVLEE